MIQTSLIRLLPRLRACMAVMALVGSLLSLAACEARPRIRLHPAASAMRPPSHAAARAAAAQGSPRVRAAEATPQSCASPASHSLSDSRKAELFRRFAAEEGEASGALPTLASPAASMSRTSASCRSLSPLAVSVAP